jgi:hypothetical protein
VVKERSLEKVPFKPRLEDEKEPATGIWTGKRVPVDVTVYAKVQGCNELGILRK